MTVYSWKKNRICTHENKCRGDAYQQNIDIKANKKEDLIYICVPQRHKFSWLWAICCTEGLRCRIALCTLFFQKTIFIPKYWHGAILSRFWARHLCMISLSKIWQEILLIIIQHCILFKSSFLLSSSKTTTYYYSS